MTDKLILASGSPRRLALLAQLGLAAHVHVSDIDESPKPDETAEVLVVRLAISKAAAVDSPDCTIVAADTVVSVGGHIYGKPQDQTSGIEMLRSLGGRTHSVFTGVCVRSGSTQHTVTVQTQVGFCPISQRMAEAYWATGEPQGKAGGYAIQGLGAAFVNRLNGSYSNVVGLPLHETAQLLARVGKFSLLEHA